MERITPPATVKRTSDCMFGSNSDGCNRKVNKQLPHGCNKYCVVDLNSWLRDSHGHLDDDDINRLIIRISEE